MNTEKIIDSNGNQLTPEQIHFFSASEIRDSKNNLCVCYHGSPNDFTEFDVHKIGSTTDNGLWGAGFYFSTFKKQAEIYGKVKEYYLNCINPFYLNKYKTCSELADFLDIDESILTIHQRSKLIRPLYSYINTFTSHIMALGYDCIWVNLGTTNEIVVFNPANIKSINNENPTKSSNNVNESKEPNNDDRIKSLRKCVESSWSIDTAHPSYKNRWSASQPATGQCAVTALLLNDLYGWDIYDVRVGNTLHFYNKDENGQIVDLTAQQFSPNTNIPYEKGRLRNRKDLIKVSNLKTRYELLLNNFNTQSKMLPENFNPKGCSLNEDWAVPEIDALIRKNWEMPIPSTGPTFITPQGTFITIYPMMDDHEDLCCWLTDQGINNPEDGDWIVDTFNYARCRDSLHLCFLQLPKETTTAQQYAIQEWMETQVQTDSIEIITPNGQTKTYSTDDYFPEDLIKIIKRYYSSGTLYESLNTIKSTN